MFDAIIVLARGINPDGSLSPDSESRVRKAVELYNQEKAQYVVMSGAWSYHLDNLPAQPEATAMKSYATSLGVLASSIVEELRSKDTIGNTYFIKKDICEPHGWTKLLVVASEEHMQRVKYLFEKIFGPDYTLTYVASERVLGDEAYQKEQEHEKQSLIIARKWLDEITDGDDYTIYELMKTHHPAYQTPPGNNS